MATRRYTVEELLLLRDSPLVKKPEHLPAIEQWIEYVYLDVDGAREKLRIPHSESQQQQQQQRQSVAGRQQRPTADASPMGNFSTGQRPSLMQARSSAARSGGEDYIRFLVTRMERRLTKSVEDITLGPPKTLFASSRNTARLADFADKPTTPLTEAALNDEQEGQRGGRMFGDKQTNRKSTNSGETDGRHNRESWTSARERRALVGDDDKAEGGERHNRYGRREQDGERRNGYGDKQDTRWGRTEDKQQNGEKQGGWREREKEKRDRDWDRGGRVEKKPEWMDDPAPKQDEDLSMMSMPKNQDDFEKWKQAQHARNKKSTEEMEPMPAELPPAPKEATPMKSAASKLEGVTDKPFGGLSEFRRAEGAAEGAPTPAKTATAKGGKTSRFMPMFKKDEPVEEPPQQLPAQTSIQKIANEVANDSAEDKEGFQRILQMLGGNGTSQTPTPNEPLSPAPRQVSNGTKRQSRFTGFFDQTPKSPERLQSPQSGGQAPFKPMDTGMLQGGRGMTEEPGSVFGGRLPDSQPNGQIMRSQPPASLISPEPVLPGNGSRDHQRPPSGRMNDLFLDNPPSRGAATPDINIQNLLASQRNQRAQGPDKNSEFLLNLLQTKGSRPPSQQARPEGNFPLWLEQPPNMPETHAPKPRAPQQPGMFEDQLLRNHPQELPRQEQQQMNEMPQRRTSQRAPPGFFDEQNLFLQQQQQHHRRNFTEPPQQHVPPPGRRMSGHPNLPQMQVPQQAPPFPPEFLQSPSAQAPPPGFNPHMPRHPPGFHNIPNIFQAPQPQQQREPSGFAGVGGGPGMMHQQQQTTSPPNVPPGFYGGPPGLPPGFMQMRSPTDGISAGAAGLRGNGIGNLGRGFEGYESMQRR
ncbi:hypothetical protein LTR85_008152 [Meristemomyces frigidus]|nr:hypothetical protein LTR85_008152 [Meristemomyces frigidus]